MANSEFKVFEFEEDDITKDKKYKDLIDKRVGALPRAVLVGPSEAGKTQFIHNVLWQWCKDYYFKNDSSKIIVSQSRSYSQSRVLYILNWSSLISNF